MCYILCEFLFKEMGPYCLFLIAFGFKIRFFQRMGFKGQRMCCILRQFLFKEMGPYCLFLPAFWSKLEFFPFKGFEGLIMCGIMGPSPLVLPVYRLQRPKDVLHTASIPFQRNGSLLPVPDCVLVQIRVFPV